MASIVCCANADIDFQIIGKVESLRLCDGVPSHLNFEVATLGGLARLWWGYLVYLEGRKHRSYIEQL